MNYLAILNKPISNKSVKFENKFITINQYYTLKHWDDYYNKKTKQHIFILGRPVIELDQWKNYDDKPAFISRILISEYQNKNIIEFAGKLNGAFTIVITDEYKRQLLLITDKLGIYPVYCNRLEDLNNFQIATHPDILAAHCKSCNLDMTSVAEFLKKGMISPPHTYYDNISSLNHRSIYRWDFYQKRFENLRYFDFIFRPQNNFHDLVYEMSMAISNAVQRRTVKHFGKKALFLSGGSDSRAILCSSIDHVEAITLYNITNLELETTKRITKRLKVTHHLLKREFDYYLNSLEESVLGSGGLSDVTSEHFLNIKSHPIIQRYDSHLTGCYFDYLFKGLSFNPERVKILNINIPINKFGNFKYSPIVKFSPISQNFEVKILSRDESIYSGFKNWIDLEIKTLFPLFRQYDSITRLSLQRFFQWDVPSSDNDIISVYLRIPPNYKINSQVYNRAVANISRCVGDIPHANMGHRIGSSLGRILMVKSFNKLKRAVKKPYINKLYGEGSWIHFDEYARRSKNANELWNRIAVPEREIINNILGCDAWKEGKDYVLKKYMGHFQLFRILTFAKWHELLRESRLSYE